MSKRKPEDIIDRNCVFEQKICS